MYFYTVSVSTSPVACLACRAGRPAHATGARWLPTRNNESSGLPRPASPSVLMAQLATCCMPGWNQCAPNPTTVTLSYDMSLRVTADAPRVHNSINCDGPAGQMTVCMHMASWDHASHAPLYCQLRVHPGSTFSREHHGSAACEDSLGGPRQYQMQLLEHLTSCLRAICEAQ